MNEFYIGSLNLSPYFKDMQQVAPVRYEIRCLHVPRHLLYGMYANPIIALPVYFRSEQFTALKLFGGYPKATVCADFLFLYAPYVEVNWGFCPHLVEFRVRALLYAEINDMDWEKR